MILSQTLGNISIFKLLLVSAFLNALCWIIIIPIWQYPDEQAHFAQVQDYAELGTRNLNGFDTSQEVSISEEIFKTKRDSAGNNNFTYHPQFKLQYEKTLNNQWENLIKAIPISSRKALVKVEATYNPPLYYFFSALIYKLFYQTSLLTRVLVIRIFSSLLFILTVIFAYKTSKLIYKSEVMSLALATIVANFPMLIFSSTGVLPDPLTNLLFSMFTYFSLKWVVHGFRLYMILLLTIIVTLGVLTRQHFLIALAIIPFPIFLSIRKNPKSMKKIAIAILITIVFMFYANTIGTTLPLISNFRVADPSIFNLKQMSLDKIIQNNFWTLKHTAREVLPWYWGVYKWLSLTLPHPYYKVVNRLIAIALIGVAIKIYKMFKNHTVGANDIGFLFLIYASFAYFITLATWDFFFISENGYSFGIQGRYYFPLVISHFIILFGGMNQILSLISKKAVKYGMIFFVLLMVFANYFSLAYVSASYYSVQTVNRFLVEMNQYKPDLLKGNLINVIFTSTIIFQVLFLFNITKYLINKNESSKRDRN